MTTLQGQAVYAPEKEALVWKIRNFPGGKEYLLRCKFGLPSVAAEEEAPGRMPPIRVGYEIPYFTVSGIQVRGPPQVVEYQPTGAYLPGRQCVALCGAAGQPDLKSVVYVVCNAYGHVHDSVVCPWMQCEQCYDSDCPVGETPGGIQSAVQHSGAGAVPEGDREEWLSGAAVGEVYHHRWRV